MMFKSNNWVPSPDDLKKIRALGDTEGGSLLSRYIEGEVEGAVSKAMSANLTDVQTIARAQAYRSCGTWIWRLLNENVDDILRTHNMEAEDESGNQSGLPENAG